jgi:hypothetical protein
MALRALTDKAEIADAMQRLAGTLSRGATKPYLVIDVPGEGGTWGKPVPVIWHQHLELWAYFGIELAGTRYWCCYGVVSPAVAPKQTPVVEINSPLEGRNWRVRGVFARDVRGSTYYLHTGGIAGGSIPHTESQILNPRPSAKGFAESRLWTGERTLVEWQDGNSREMYVVGQLNHDSLAPTLAAYVHAALKYRLLTGQAPPVKSKRTVFLSHSNADGDRQWCDEFVGTLKASRDVWYDLSSLVPGMLGEQLTKQIAQRDSFVLALSRNALGSEYVRQEIEWALTLREEKELPRITPVRLDDCPIPSALEQFFRVCGPEETAISPGEAAHKVEQMLSEWEKAS